MSKTIGSKELIEECAEVRQGPLSAYLDPLARHKFFDAVTVATSRLAVRVRGLGPIVICSGWLSER
jgi:hypothetical protein